MQKSSAAASFDYTFCAVVSMGNDPSAARTVEDDGPYAVEDVGASMWTLSHI